MNLPRILKNDRPERRVSLPVKMIVWFLLFMSAITVAQVIFAVDNISQRNQALVRVQQGDTAAQCRSEANAVYQLYVQDAQSSDRVVNRKLNEVLSMAATGASRNDPEAFAASAHEYEIAVHEAMITGDAAEEAAEVYNKAVEACNAVLADTLD